MSSYLYELYGHASTPVVAAATAAAATATATATALQTTQTRWCMPRYFDNVSSMVQTHLTGL